MKIKDYLETLPENINISGMKGLFGKELKILEPYFESIDELKGKKIEIIEEINMVGEPIGCMRRFAYDEFSNYQYY